MKRVTLLVVLLLILNLSILIFIANSKLMIYNTNFYKSEFKKNMIYQEVGNADEVLNNILLFFKNKAQLGNYFEENEKSHLQDVKNLIKYSDYALYGSIALEITLLLILFFIYRKYIPAFFSIAGLSFIATGLLILMTSIILYILSGSFSELFVKFHLIFFPQGNWQFPETSVLIRMFPEKFFYDFTYKAFSNSVFTALITTIAGIISFVPNQKIKDR